MHDTQFRKLKSQIKSVICKGIKKQKQKGLGDYPLGFE